MKQYVHRPSPHRRADSTGMATSEFAVGTLAAASIAGAIQMWIRPEVMPWLKNLLALAFSQIFDGWGF